MRLTLINQFYVPDISPTAHLAASLAEHRAALGDQVTVVTGAGSYVQESTRGGVQARENPRIVRLWTPSLGKKTILRRVADYASFYSLAAVALLKLPPQDAVIAMTTPPFIACAGLLHKGLHPRCRLILWSMDCYPEAAERAGVLNPRGVLSAIMRVVNRQLYRRLDHLVCLDTAMRELLVSQYAPTRPLPTSIIPNWERASLFPRDPQSAPWKEAQALGLRERTVVLYMGNAGTGHDFATVLDAASLLASEPVTFLFVGGGSRWEPLSREVAVRGLRNVVMRGYVAKEERPSVMATAACALITLRDDMLGVMSPSKLHASLGMGLPVAYVGPARSNVDDAVARFGCGVSLRHGDSAGLASFVKGLMGDEASRRELSARARRAFDEAYCDLRTLEQFDAILNGLAPGIAPHGA